MKEPYFMQQIHKEREKESRVLWAKFGGDFYKYHQWRMENLQRELKKMGWSLKLKEQQLVKT